ncbi:MAG: enoyl-CoA hydratase/isomerase family protein [Deltaproteobacteria bacterium]|nr:enoyl-CoA hydratase/isomerase family protein [Deltaproteobacteria bacterium]MBW2383651.1 enoyl-CoA hydratase/isomerase family protein [Deltaproteobacteria bacterium]MBW2697812.1 enoyl-CoA hydratase/isomerase family protein [Deltaproteobacteria bacterium]
MGESKSHLLVEKRDGVMILTMNRPEVKNALSPQMLVKLAAAWYEFRDSDDLRVAILTGAGDEDFSSGGDLKLTMPLMTGARQPEDEWDHKLLGDLKQFVDAILRGFELYKPVIAAVNGRALGGGAEITNACDLRVAAEHAIFGTPEAKVGLLPGGGSLTRLPRQIPWAKAMEILMIGDPFSAQEALEMGLLNYVVPREKLMDKAMELAAKLAGNGPLAVRKAKEGIIRSSGLPLAQAYEIENEVSAAVMQSKDAREGPRAFKEKRKPNFIGE